MASAEMAAAVRVVTVERGVDPRELTLVAFGGAGPLHAAQIADELGMRRVVVPHASGVLSALGLVLAERRRDLVESVLLAGDELTRDAVATVVERLGARARDALRTPSAELRVSYDLRYAGQAFELTVEGPPDPLPEQLRHHFDRAHAERYGYDDPAARLELVTVRVAAVLPGAEPAPSDATPAEERGNRRLRVAGETVDARVLGQGLAELEGPAIFELPGATLVVPPGWGANGGGEAVELERV